MDEIIWEYRAHILFEYKNFYYLHYKENVLDKNLGL
jgi:hypothetical protein